MARCCHCIGHCSCVNQGLQEAPQSLLALRRPADPPSASDIVIDSICEYALEGYGRASDMYVDPEVSVEKDRRRRVSRAKAAAAEKDTRRKR